MREVTEMSYPRDPVSPEDVPRLRPLPGATPPRMPEAFTVDAILHPFAPPPTHGSGADTPFYHLSIARMTYRANKDFTLDIVTSAHDAFRYHINADNEVRMWKREPSRDGQRRDTWHVRDLKETGWRFPRDGWFGGATPTCAGVSAANWVEEAAGHISEWWKYPVKRPHADEDKDLQDGNDKEHEAGVTWVWFDANSDTSHAIPHRMMFGVAPPSPTTGDHKQLPVLQNFSYVVFSNFRASAEEWSADYQEPTFEGFSFVKDDAQPLFRWYNHQSLSALMTPVDATDDPFPTRVLYRWDTDEAFRHNGVRGQNTLLQYPHHSPGEDNGPLLEINLLTRKRPDNTPHGYRNFYFPTNERAPDDRPKGRLGDKPDPKFDWGVEPPYWLERGGGRLHARLSDNPDAGPKTHIHIWSVDFPPSSPHYLQGTYLWAWYVPLTEDGSRSRPMTFMQSGAKFDPGTVRGYKSNLALADYFFFKHYDRGINPLFFDIPPPEEIDAITDA